MSRFPFIFIAGVWVIGLYAGDVLQIQHSTYYLTSAIFLLFLLPLYKHQSKVLFFLLLLSIFLLSFARIGWHHTQHQSFFSKESIEQIDQISLRGYISSKPIVDGNAVSFTVNPKSYLYNNHTYSSHLKEQMLTYVYLKNKEEVQVVKSWRQGMGITLKGSLHVPLVANNPGAFNYKKYLERQSIFWRLSVDGITNVRISDGDSVKTAFNDFKEYLSNQLNPLPLTEQKSGFIRSIILGDRSNLDQNIKDSFSIIGLSHLIAISGLHLSVLSLLFFWFIHGIGITREKSIYIVSGILVFYMLLTGASASVVRATIMTIIILQGVVLKKDFSAFQAFSLSIFLMTLYRPMWIYDIGFQLSFIITFFLLHGHKKIAKRLSLRNSYLRNLIAVTIITQLSSFPLVFYYFHQYSFLASVSNLLIVPIFSIVILPIALILLLASSLKLAIAKYLAVFVSYILEGLFRIIQFISDIDFFHIYGGLSLTWVIFLYILVLWMINRKTFVTAPIDFSVKKTILLIEKLIMISLSLVVFYSIISDNRGVITAIDVGQGDSILIQTPNQFTILVDSGGAFHFTTEKWQKKKQPFDPGKDIILPLLHYKGIGQIDMAIITHEDFDHMGGFLSLVDHIKINSFVVSDEFPRTEAGRKLYDKLLEQHIRIVKLSRPKVIKDDEVEISLLPIYLNDNSKENNKMIVIAANIYQTKLLLTGDLEVSGERLLAEGYFLKEIDILKIAHHGADTSSSNAFLSKIKPKEAIISVGSNNRYNHPAESVIHRLEEKKINIWRTDLNGAITIQIEPDKYKIEGMVEK